MEQGNGRIVAAEAIGTAILIFGGPGTAILAGDDVGVLGIALGFGLSLMIAAYLIGHISGCHINPAVTLAMWLTKKVSSKRAIASVAGQLVGGIGAAAIVYGIASGRDGYQRGGFASNGWGKLSQNGYGLGSTIIVEIVLTAVLVLVVLGTTHAKFPAAMGPVAAGMTLTVIHLISIPVDSTSVNPARSIATAVFSDPDLDHLKQLWAFIVFPLIGAVVGVIAWLVIDDSALESTRLDTGVTRAVRDAADKVADEVDDTLD